MRRAAAVLKFAITCAVAVTLAILILRGRDPTFANFHHRSPAEQALDRVIQHVEMHQVPCYQAIDDLSRVAGIKIECADEFTSTAAYFHNIDLVADNITLADALARILPADDPDAISVFPDGDRIRIGPRRPEALCLDEYSMPDFIPGRGLPTGQSVFTGSANQTSLFAGPSPASWPPLFGAGDYETTEAIGLLIPFNGVWREPVTPGDHLAASFQFPNPVVNETGVLVSPPHLFALGTATFHRRLRGVISALASDAPPEALGGLPAGTRIVDAIDGRLRQRAVFTGDPILDRILPAVRVGSLTIYDLRPYFAQLQERDRTHRADELINAVYMANQDDPARGCFFGSMLLVNGSIASQRLIDDRVLKIINGSTPLRPDANAH